MSLHLGDVRLPACCFLFLRCLGDSLHPSGSCRSLAAHTEVSLLACVVCHRNVVTNGSQTLMCCLTLTHTLCCCVRRTPEMLLLKSCQSFRSTGRDQLIQLENTGVLCRHMELHSCSSCQAEVDALCVSVKVQIRLNLHWLSAVSALHWHVFAPINHWLTACFWRIMWDLAVIHCIHWQSLNLKLPGIFSFWKCPSCTVNLFLADVLTGSSHDLFK